MFCHRQTYNVTNVQSARSAPTQHGIRFLSSSLIRSGIFSRSQEPASVAAHPVPADHDSPLTPFQSQIAALETEALAEPEDLEKQLALLRALLEGGEFMGITKYYDVMALSTEGTGSKALLESSEALNLYLEALGKIGRMKDIAGAVRQRDTLRGSTVSTTTIPTATPSPTASSTGSILSGVISSSTPAPSTASVQSTQPGTPLAPIYVQMAPATPQMSAMRALRWLIGMMFWAFIILTIMSMVMENTGLMKAGPGPAEFEPEEGKVVKFSDVHGVEEAKTVSRLCISRLTTGIGRGCRVSQEPREVFRFRWKATQGRSAYWTPWYWKNNARKSRRWRSRGPFLICFRIKL